MTIKLYAKVRQLLASRRGQDLVEYALLAGFVAVAAAAIFPTTIAPQISTIFSKISSLLTYAPGF